MWQKPKGWHAGAEEHVGRTRLFLYQHGRLAINRIQYLRWSQAWMYYALGELIKAKIE